MVSLGADGMTGVHCSPESGWAASVEARPVSTVGAGSPAGKAFMLALSRGEGQSIIIDGNIEVKIVKWSRSSVRLAIQAPREVSVDRDEIWRKMHPGEPTPLEVAERQRQERMEGGETKPPQEK